MRRETFVIPRRVRKKLEDKHLPTRDRSGDNIFRMVIRKPLVKKTTTVYKGWKKFFLTKKEAARYEAKMLLRSQCNCEGHHRIYDYDWSPCRYHAMSSEKWLRLRDKIMWRILIHWGKQDGKT